MVDICVEYGPMSTPKTKTQAAMREARAGKLHQAKDVSSLLTELTVTKVTFNIPTSELTLLRHLASRRGTTVTTALRKAIGTEVFLDENERKGSIVLLKEKDGRLTRVVRQ
jgi:hypothetical protein